MKQLALAVLALGSMALAVPAAHAGPELTVGCGVVSSDDPTGAIANPGTQVGYLESGPVVVNESGTLTCSVQVGGSGQHSDADAQSISRSGSGVVILEPTLMSYQTTAQYPVFVCTEWSGPSGTWYMDASNNSF